MLTVAVLLCTAWLGDVNNSGCDDSSESAVDGIRRPCRRRRGNSSNSGQHCLNTETSIAWNAMCQARHLEALPRFQECLGGLDGLEPWPNSDASEF